GVGTPHPRSPGRYGLASQYLYLRQDNRHLHGSHGCNTAPGAYHRTQKRGRDDCYPNCYTSRLSVVIFSSAPASRVSHCLTSAAPCSYNFMLSSRLVPPSSIFAIISRNCSIFSS